MTEKIQLRVKIITWNLGDNKLTQAEWLDEIKKSWSIITVKDYDVLGLCLQEDSRGKFGKLAEAIAQFLGPEFSVASDSVEGPPEISKLSFSVRAYLYLRKSIFRNPSIKTQDACLARAVYCTKSSAGVSVIAVIDGKILQILLISSHLPINTKKEDLGYAERIAAVKRTFEEVYDKIVDRTIPQRVAFWGGDLNFRSDTPTHEGGNPMKDQLLYAFSTRPASFFREFAEPDVEFPPTCKMVTCDKLNCPACRNRSGQTFNPTCYVQEGAKGGITRHPSHCDRILYRADDVDGEIIDYKSWGGARTLQHSDHNLVYLAIELIV